MTANRMRRRLMPALAGALALAAMGAPAAARELPPWVYEQARAAAGTVVVLRVTAVQALPPGEAQGTCELQGVIESIERGAATEGQEVTLSVPCIGPEFEPMPGPFPGYDQDGLLAAERVRVWMSGGQLVRRGLDFVTEDPA